MISTYNHRFLFLSLPFTRGSLFRPLIVYTSCLRDNCTVFCKRLEPPRVEVLSYNNALLKVGGIDWCSVAARVEVPGVGSLTFISDCQYLWRCKDVRRQDVGMICSWGKITVFAKMLHLYSLNTNYTELCLALEEFLDAGNEINLHL